MDVLAPWSLASYLPLNGFHPLYRSLARLRQADLRFITPAKPGLDLFRSMQAAEEHQGRTVGCPDWVHGADSKLMFHEFVREHGADDIWWQSNLAGDVELHHTAPATRGDRPFILHCESFLPVFFPFFQQGEALDLQRVDAIRQFYQQLFESQNCLAIVSHIPHTLEQLAAFFRSEAIDRKLVGMPIGLDEAYIAEDVMKPGPGKRFVFLSSAHQNMRSFALRGGVSALKLAMHLLRHDVDATFFFRDRRPLDTSLAEYGIDLAELRQFEGTRIVWIEHYLPDRLQTALIASCHFLLLPSANLHSVSIMSALANGTVPIVTDTFGTDLYVEDMVNGVVLDGVRSAVWSRDEALRITQDRHDRFLQMEPVVTTALINRLGELLAAPDRICAMAEAGRKTIRQRFDGARFASSLMEQLRTRWLADGARAAADRPAMVWRGAGERGVEDVAHSHFEHPPQPLLRVRLPHGSIFQFGRNFVFVPLTLIGEFTRDRHNWSLLRCADAVYDPGTERFPGVRHASSLAHCLRLSRASGPLGGTQVSAGWFGRGFTQRAAMLLRPYRSVYVVARAGYRAMHRLRLVR